MIPHEPRRLGYYASSNWVQWAVLLVVLGLLATGLLWSLDDASERAERQSVELTIRNMRTGMQLAMGEALMRQREREIASWVGGNPVDWLNTSLARYRGECTEEERRSLSGGEWCFERSRRELVYHPRHIDHLREQSEGRSLPCSQLSWRVNRAPESAASGGFVGLRIEAASDCRWVLEGVKAKK